MNFLMISGFILSLFGFVVCSNDISINNDKKIIKKREYGTFRFGNGGGGSGHKRLGYYGGLEQRYGYEQGNEHRHEQGDEYGYGYGHGQRYSVPVSYANFFGRTYHPRRSVHPQGF